MTTVCLSRTTTEVVAERIVVTGPSWSALTSGVRHQRRHLLEDVEAHHAAFRDLRRDAQRDTDVAALDGVERLPRLVSLVDVEAMNGTFWPTTISASWLSVVRMFGADRMFTSVLPSDARDERDLRRHDRAVRQADGLIARRRGDQAGQAGEPRPDR